MNEAEAQAALLRALKARHYHFITPTPLTHARVVARRENARDLRDMLGWSLPFARDAIDGEIVDWLERGGLLEAHDALLKSRVRVSSLGNHLFLHSAFPTTQKDAVFFGPDTYRFAAFLQAELPMLGKRDTLIDIGCGSGAGAIVAAAIAKPETTIFNDINPRALSLAKINAQVAGTSSQLAFAECESIARIEAPSADLIIANPPYIIDAARRAYRDGGSMYGAEISLNWAKAAAERLERGGAFLLYTGSAIIAGEDRFRAALHDAMPGFDIAYSELDPDVFGEELERDDYAEVERIAVVGVVAVKR